MRRSPFATPDIARLGEILNKGAALLDTGRIRSTATELLGLIDVKPLKRADTILEIAKAQGKPGL